MTIKKFNNKLVDRALKHYKYDQKVEGDLRRFLKKYKRYTDKESLRHYIYSIFGVLNGHPNSTHIQAKNLLFSGNEKCWQYFERTAVFWCFSHINDPWVDHLKKELEYALYIERGDLLELLLKKGRLYLSDEENQANKDFINQKVYPSTYLVHFLVGKWLGDNPIEQEVLKYGDGYGIYQPIIDNWVDLSVLEDKYWDSLCEYHLSNIGLQRASKRENEEFLGCGLVPMELINLIKVRRKLGLDVPEIKHELFQTPMAKEPVLPTGYDQETDVLFKLVELTVQNKKRFTYEEVVEKLKAEYPDKELLLS